MDGGPNSIVGPCIRRDCQPIPTLIIIIIIIIFRLGGGSWRWDPSHLLLKMAWGLNLTYLLGHWGTNMRAWEEKRLRSTNHGWLLEQLCFVYLILILKLQVNLTRCHLMSLICIILLHHVDNGIVWGVWGHVNGLEKYECFSWRVCIRLTIICGGRVWWLWRRGMLLGSFLGSSVT